jgi:hypothetical protein
MVGRRKQPLSLMSVCVHEAGHAVAHYLYRVPMIYVSVVPSSESTGHVLHVDKHREQRLNAEWREARARAYAQRLISCALAGGIAQKNYNPRTFHEDHTSVDWDSALRWATTQSASLEEALAWCNLIYIQTKQDLLTPRNWATIMILAKELRSKKFLSSRDTRRIISEGELRYVEATLSQSSA